MMKASAMLVIVLGVIMVGRGLNLSGVALASPLTSPGSGNIARVEGNIQFVTTELQNGRYQPIVVQKGIPVRWTIKADAGDLNGCNYSVAIPKYDLQKRLIPGDNIIEFTPQEEGNITYTCWMGMLNGYVKVVDDVQDINIEKIKKEIKDYTTARKLSGLGGASCH